MSEDQSLDQHPVVVDTGPYRDLLDSGRFHQLWRVSKMFAASDLLPAHFRDNPSNVCIMLQYAMRLQVDAVTLMQASYVIHGKPGIEAKMAIALANTRGPFEHPIMFKSRGDGDNLSVTAWSTISGAKVEQHFSMAMAKKNGYLDRKGRNGERIETHWDKDPELMCTYRAAKRLINLYCPDVVMGLPTVEELHDYQIIDGEASVEVVAADKGVSGLKQRLGREKKAPVPPSVPYVAPAEPSPADPSPTPQAAPAQNTGGGEPAKDAGSVQASGVGGNGGGWPYDAADASPSLTVDHVIRMMRKAKTMDELETAQALLDDRKLSAEEATKVAGTYRGCRNYIKNSGDPTSVS